MAITALIATLTAPAGSALAAEQDQQERIVGGSSTTIAEWPWQVALTLNPASFPGTPYDRQICGGTLVAPTIIVTAAHCVYNFGGDTWFPPSRFASITGRTTLTNTSQGQEIAWNTYFFFVDGSGNKRFDPGTFRWDVVFARLSSPSPSSNSTPIRIAGANEASFWAPGDENVWATGWGHTFFGGFKTNTLREVNLDRLPDSACSNAYGAAHHSETMLCAGEMTGDQSPCHGDSGGPLVTPIGGGTFRLVGDISWGFECGAPNLPGNFGRVAQDPICTTLRNSIQAAAGVNVVGPGGCLPPSPPSSPPSPSPPPPVALAAAAPRNDFVLGKLVRNVKKGIAFLIAEFPGPGEVGLQGKGLKTIGLGSATARSSRAVSGGRVKLKVAPAKKGKRARKIRRALERKGKARIEVRVTYIPTGGVAATQSKKSKLKKR